MAVVQREWSPLTPMEIADDRRRAVGCVGLVAGRPSDGLQGRQVVEGRQNVLQRAAAMQSGKLSSNRVVCMQFRERNLIFHSIAEDDRT